MQRLPHFVPSDFIKVETIKLQFQQLLADEKQYFHQYPVDKWMKNRTQFCDDVLTHIFQTLFPNMVNISLFAVGGYGREELFPHSDLDLFILIRQPILAHQPKIEEFIQILWDCGLKIGIAVRDLSETFCQAQQNITIATNLLERRFLAGDITLAEELNVALRQSNNWSPVAFFQAKIAEQQKRYQRFHQTSYNLEPDLKYNLGGLRDLHLLYWLALRDTGAKSLEQILAQKWIDQDEYQQIKESQQFLFRLRYALHLLNSRSNDRLYFEQQKQLASFLKYTEDSSYANANVEAMMKQYFQTAQFISTFCHIVVQHYFQKFETKNRALFEKALDKNYCISDKFIRLKNINAYREQPASILDLFHYLIDYPDREIYPDTLRHLLKFKPSTMKLLCDNAEARIKFLALFTKANVIQCAFIPLHRYGILKKYLPNWEKVTGLMQFDLFHNYSVDEHIIRVLQTIENFDLPDNHLQFPLIHTVFEQIKQNPITLRTLYLAALFHDIAKGRGGDHSELALQDVEDFCTLHQIPEKEMLDIAWLVKHHLIMSMTAQRRDIQDSLVIQAFAQNVGSAKRLNLLLCLTVADICGTGEKRWDPWKASLLKMLYQNTLQQLQKGTMTQFDPTQEIISRKKQAETQLLRLAYKKADIFQIWEKLPPRYFLRTEIEQIVQHTQWLAERENALLVKVHQQSQGTEVFIACTDQPGLFYKVVALLERKKFDIHQAQIITTENGDVLDSFIISEQQNMQVAQDRCIQLEQALTEALLCETLPLLNIKSLSKTQPFEVPTVVKFIRSKEDQTEFELTTLDKQGLLANVGKIFYELKLNLRNAKISTIGEKAQDFFIITNQQGQALTFTEKQKLREALIENLN